MRSSILLFLLLVQINHQVELGLCNQEMIYIKPSPNIACPGTPCYTLMQYVTNQSSASNVSLLLLPGNHQLTTKYYVADKSSILMMAYNPGVSSMVACNSSGRMSFRSLETVRISGIFFNGCGGNKAVSVKNFIFEGSNFMNGSNDDDGGAWSIFQPNTLMIINCTFANNVVKGSFKGGGALHILGSERCNITIIWCTFSRNAVIDFSKQSSVDGGALHISSVTDLSVNIVESIFINNQVNSTAVRGGAIYAFRANLTIGTCKFENNEAIGTSSGEGDRNTIANGGVLYASRTNLTIINGTFRNNQAKGTFTNGGALYISTTNLIFHGSLCTGNQANSTGKGGALYLIETNSTISKSVFSSNQANGSYSRGGALYSTFYPLVPGEKVSTVMNGCIFTENHANFSGGAVHIDGTQNPIITDCNFSNNRLLQSFARGGAIYVTNSVNLTTVDCSFNSNSAAERLGKGGALYTSTTYTHLQRSRFSNNGADIDGGTVYVEIHNSYGAISTYQCSFYKNAGGAVYGINIRKVSIHLSNFTSNINSASAALHVLVASQNTTIIQELESAILISQSHFTENSRAAYSKGIKQIYIQSSMFASNNGSNKIVEIFGNGLPDNVVLISNSIFERNNGTAIIYNDNIALLSIDQSTFTGNAASHSSDGVIYVSGSHTNVSISHSSFQQNSAASCGVVSVHSLTDGDISESMLSPRHGISLYSNTFKHNMATISGSVGCFRNASVTISNNIFTHNVASCDGGVFLINSSTVTISESSFTNNNADYGGVARVFDSLVVLTESTFEQNTVSSSGGVFSAEMSNITIRNSTLNSNRAGNNGSIIAIYHSPLKFMILGVLQILSSNFSDNSALNGGIFYGENGAIDVDVQNSQLGFNNLTERGTFAAVENLALSIAWKDSDGIQGGNIFACNSVIIGYNNSIIVTESTDCLISTCKSYIFADTNEESIDHLNRMALVATCTAKVADVTEAATVTESDNGAMIVALSSTFSTLTVLMTLLVVIVVLVAMANKKLKSKSALGRDILQGKLSTPACYQQLASSPGPFSALLACNIENLGMDQGQRVVS